MQPDPTSRPAPPATPPSAQIERMRTAIAQAVASGPAFLRGDVDADYMAHVMVGAVNHYVEGERAAGSSNASENAQAQALQHVIGELMACGSGYLAGRCDAACVGRTMTYMVNEFGTR